MPSPSAAISRPAPDAIPPPRPGAAQRVDGIPEPILKPTFAGLGSVLFLSEQGIERGSGKVAGIPNDLRDELA
jgi:hypothetical protein